MNSKLIFLLALTITFIRQGKAQDIATITTLPKAGISGGINISGQYYSVTGREARRSPYSYVISGNTRFKLGLINVPLSFSFRDQSFSYGASFNKFGMSPYYKWAKLHLGHRTMSFSKYSLAGKNFFGVGTELTPGKFRFSAFRGTLRNHLAQRDTLVYGANLVPTYKRQAYGFKVGLGNYRNHFDLIYLKIKDDNTEDFEGDINAITQLDPAENLVWGTEWKFQVIKQLSINGNINVSAYTENMELKSTKSVEELANIFGGFMNVNPSTKASAAGELGMNLNLNKVQLGLNYRRIEPNYRSLGSPFIQADVASYTVNTNLSLFKNLMSLSAQAGIEKNNLRKLDYLGRKRVITAIRTNIIPSKNFNASINYSNYQYESVDGLVEINDTLRYVNVNRSLGTNLNYKTINKDFNYGAFLNLNRMVVEDLSPIQTINQDITTFMLNLGLSLDWKLLQLSVKPSIIYNQFTLVDKEQNTYGLGLRATKTFFDKNLSATLNTRYTYNDQDGKRDGNVTSTTLAVNYKVTKSHSLNLNLGVLDRNSVLRKSYTEFRSNLVYGYRF